MPELPERTTPTQLVLLAAGLGARFGGRKQLAAVGPRGEPLLHYTIHDALRGGLRRIVLIIAPGTAADWSAALHDVARHGVELRFAEQHERLPGPGVSARQRPWGTGHALWCAKSAVDAPFVLANADDCYGAAALAQACNWAAHANTTRGVHAAQSATPTEAAQHAALVAFPLHATLSPRGGVNRAVCRADNAGRLTVIAETRDIRAGGDGAITGAVAGRRTRLPADTPVSMNLWAFTPAIFTPLDTGLADFARNLRDPQRDEYELPAVVQRESAAGRLQVSLLPAPAGGWCGLTHADDLPAVRAHIAALVARGDYPDPLWASP